MKVLHSYLNTHSNVIESWAFFFFFLKAKHTFQKSFYSEYYKELLKQLCGGSNEKMGKRLEQTFHQKKIDK